MVCLVIFSDYNQIREKGHNLFRPAVFYIVCIAIVGNDNVFRVQNFENIGFEVFKVSGLEILGIYKREIDFILHDYY